MSGFDTTQGEIRRLTKALRKAKDEMRAERKRCEQIVQREFNFWSEQHTFAQCVDAGFLIGRIITQITPPITTMPGVAMISEDHGKRGR